MRVLLVLTVLVVLSTPMQAQTNDVALPAGELSVWAGGAGFDDSAHSTIGVNVGYAHNTFHNPNLPLLIEYTEIGTDSSPFAFTPRMSYFGAGLRFGGARAGKKFHPYWSMAGGINHFQLNVDYPVRDSNPFTKASANRPSVGMALGINIGGNQWGIKAEFRGNKTKDLNPWIYQLGAGIYYRFGTK